MYDHNMQLNITFLAVTLALHVKHVHLILTMTNEQLSLNYVQTLDFYYCCMGKILPFPPTEVPKIQKLSYLT
jgi:hypothetical protein